MDEPKRGPGRPPKTAAEAVPETITMRVLRDFWPTEDNRVRAGTIIECDPMQALDGLEAGTMDRVRG